MRRPRVLILHAVSWVLLTGSAASGAIATAVAPIPSFEACDRALRDRPQSYLCHRHSARRSRSWSEGIRRLEGHLAISPQDNRSRLALGILLGDLNDPRTEQMLRRAADGLARDREFEVEGFARLEILNLLGRWGRLEEADAELVRSEEDARVSGS